MEVKGKNEFHCQCCLQTGCDVMHEIVTCLYVMSHYLKYADANAFFKTVYMALFLLRKAARKATTINLFLVRTHVIRAHIIILGLQIHRHVRLTCSAK